MAAHGGVALAVLQATECDNITLCDRPLEAHQTPPAVEQAVMKSSGCIVIMSMREGRAMEYNQKSVGKTSIRRLPLVLRKELQWRATAELRREWRRDLECTCLL